MGDRKKSSKVGYWGGGGGGRFPPVMNTELIALSRRSPCPYPNPKRTASVWWKVTVNVVRIVGQRSFTTPPINWVLQWNLVIKRSDITKPSYNKVILLVPALYIFFVFLPWYNEKPDITRQFHGPNDLIKIVLFLSRYVLLSIIYCINFHEGTYLQGHLALFKFSFFIFILTSKWLNILFCIVKTNTFVLFYPKMEWITNWIELNWIIMRFHCTLQ